MHASIIFSTLFALYFALFQFVFVAAAPLVVHSRSQVERIARFQARAHHSSSLIPTATLSSDDSDPTSTSESTQNNAGTFLAQAPRFVIYSDSSVDGVVPPASKLKGFNVFILAFYLDSGPSDQLQAFVDLSSSKRQAIIDNLHENKISLMFSVFGSTEAPVTNGVNPESFAAKVASFAKKYHFDGADVDFEDFDAFNNGKAINWLIRFNKALRSHLPSGEYLISHAPVAPWFTDSKDAYPHGSYLDIAQKSGKNAVDFYNIQFYNQGDLYSTCQHLTVKSPSGAYPHTSIAEIAANGVPLNSLVIGKPAVKADADGSGDQGFMSSSSLKSCLSSSMSSPVLHLNGISSSLKGSGSLEGQTWNGGAMFWEYHENSISGLISTVGSVVSSLLNAI